jgi:hypothetical protein
VGALWAAAHAPAARAQTPARPARRAGAATSPAAVDPVVPVAPDVMARDVNGRTTVRAVRLTEPLRIDGRLDEDIYTHTPSASDFIQTEPQEAVPASEKTEIWIFFDDRHVYLSARCWETRPERVIVNEMRRDNTNIGQNDNLAWLFDTLNDRRSGALFEINPLGGRMDGQSTNEESTNFDWNPVWEVKTGYFEAGWSVEAAIPFKSLRYRPGSEPQVWGFNVRRRNRWKNEVSYLSSISRALGMRGLRPSVAGSVVGIETPSGSRNLEVKPFLTSSLTTDRAARPTPLSNDPTAAVGLDVKYGVTRSLTADITVNTDFAQVEADEFQINLTRFNLLFPEKREFFLENRGIFAFGGDGADTPVFFYSRRIGLNANRLVPIRAGGRLSGRAGKFSLGMLNIQADDEPVSGVQPTNFSVMRIRRDLLGQSSVGVLFTSRSAASSPGVPATAYGVDGLFAFLGNRLQIASYWARTPTETAGDHDASYRAQVDYNGDRYGWEAEHLAVGRAFNPDVGFVRRNDMRRSFGRFRFSPRPRRNRFIRRASYTGTMTYVQDDNWRLQTREIDGEFGLEFHNTDRFFIGATDIYEFLPRPFPIAPGVTLPVEGYDFANLRVSYNFGQQRPLAGVVMAERGSFYNGTRTALTISQGRVKLANQLSVQPTYSLNRVSLEQGDFSTHLLGTRVTYTMTPLMFASALLQYNSTSSIVSANVRLRWEYRPGSELFVVLNEQRDSTALRFPSLINRALIVKINRLLQF